MGDRVRRGMQQPFLRFGWSCGPICGRRHHMDDAIAARLQRFEDPRQGRNGARLDIVEQQNAFSFGLEPADRKIVDALGGNMPPVVGEKIRTPDLDSLFGEISSTLSARNRPGIRKNGANASELSPSAAFADAMPSSISCLARSIWHAIYGQGVSLALRADAMARGEQFAHAFRIGAGHVADGEKSRLHAFGCKNVEDLIAVARQWPVIECQHDLMIGKRQRFPILHGADARMLSGVDHQRARRAERVGWPGQSAAEAA